MTDPPWRTRVRAILLHPHRPEALVLPGPTGPAPPEFDLPDRSWAGVPGPFIVAVRDLLGLDVALLRCADERVDDDARIAYTTLVFVLRDDRATIPAHATWTSAARLVDTGPAVRRAPWRQPGWLAGAQEWIVATLAALGRPVAGPVEQVRVAELSCVLRVPTAPGTVYFKASATSPLFVPEGTVMGTLAACFPGQVPAPLAVDAERGWMLLPDFGPELGSRAPVEVRADVLRAFARLQIRSTGLLDRLFAAGCLDRRPAWLARQATEWLTTADLSGWVSGEETAALRAAAPALAGMCAELAAEPVPCTLGHGDLHLGNVARGDGGYVFFDWTDACVTHPFVDLIEVFAERDGATRDRLRDAYLGVWSHLPPDRLARAWRLAAPLAALNQAISYASIVSHVEPGRDPDGLAGDTGRWLRKVIEYCR